MDVLKQIFDKILIGDWQGAWKLISMWVFFIIAISPELFGILVDAGLLESENVPALFARAINLLGVLGMLSRVIKQRAADKGILPAEDAGEAK